MADIVLINPRFEVSYWGMEHALPLIGKRANLPVACLPLLAALTPDGAHGHADRRERRGDRLGALREGRHRRRDRHERPALPHEGDPRPSSRAAAASRVVGGPLRDGAGRLLRRPGRRDLHRRGRGDLAPVPRRVGAGAAPVSLRADREDRHDARCRRRGSTCSRCGITPSAACSSRAAARSSASSATSSSRSAAGRGSRRRSRSSPSSRRSARQGCDIVFIVDDNLIGNKKAIKEVLRGVIAWQKRTDYPSDVLHRGVDRPGRRRRADGADGRGELHRAFSSASRARTRSRSARPRSIRTSATGGTLLEKVHRIQDAGMEVWCGMIMGFDNDDAAIFDAPDRVHPASRGSPSR